MLERALADLPLRLRLLALGELPAGPVPEWLLVWFYRHGDPATLASAHHASPARRALAVQRHHPRARHSLVECLEGARQAVHPQLRLVWLLHATQHDAVSDLLRLLADPSLEEDLVGALAWTLGQFGREIVLPIGDRFPFALKGIKDRYCQALWYLGTEARGCERWFHDHDTAWSRAVLYRMDGWGVELLMRWRAAPLWLDRHSLTALAEKAFSLDREERLYAVRALSGWGPQLHEAANLLQALTLDQDAGFAQGALVALRALKFRIEPQTLRALLLRPEKQLGRLAVISFFEEFDPEELQSEPEISQLVLKSLVAGSSEVGPTLVRNFLSAGNALEVRLTALSTLLRVGGQAEEVVAYLNDSNRGMRQAAAQALVESARPEVLLQLLDDPNIRRQIRSNHTLLYALAQWTPEQFNLLLDTLARKDPSLLEQLALESIQWKKYASFNLTQRQVAWALIEFHQRFPLELLAGMLDGRALDAEALHLMSKYCPPQDLAQCLAELGPSGGRQSLAEWLAITLFPPFSEVSEQRDKLALALLPLAKEGRNFLESYLHGSRPSRQLLQMYPEHPGLRSSILQWLRLWRPSGILTKVRALKRDADPALRLDRLFLIHELGRLNPVELRQLEKIARERPDLAAEIALLKRGVSSAGSQPDCPECPGQPNEKGDL